MPIVNTPWRSVAAAFALNGVLLGSWAARVPAVALDFGLDEGALGLLLLVIGVGALVSFPLAGKLADRFGAMQVTRLIAGAYVVSIALVGLAPVTPVLALSLFLFGMCHGAMDVTMNSWAAEVERHMGRSVMSSFHAMWSLGAGFGAAGGFVATSFAAPVALHFTVAAILSAMLFGPFLRLEWTSRKRSRSAADPVFAFPRGALVLVGLVALGAGIGEGAAVDWSAVLLTDVIGASEPHATLGYAVFSMAMVAMRLWVDRLITHLGPSRVAMASGFIAAAGCLLCVVSANLLLALAGFLLMGLGYAAVIPLAFSRAAADPTIPAGQAIASVATLAYGAMLIGPPAIGFIADMSSLRVSFVMVGLFALLIAFLSPVLGRSAPQTA